jgi:hypothetical protein
MLRYRSALVPLRRQCLCLYSTRSTPTTTTTTPDDDQLRTARAWLAALNPDTLPLRALGELSFSRSSGPGGQNVNK